MIARSLLARGIINLSKAKTGCKPLENLLIYTGLLNEEKHNGTDVNEQA